MNDFLKKDCEVITKYNICAAVEQDYGIGYQARLPWPSIRADYKHYLALTSKKKDPGKKVLNIKGRATYEDSLVSTELERPGVITVIVSNTYKDCPEHAYKVVPSIDAAMDLLRVPPLRDQVESVWIMGGQQIYQEAIQSPRCHRIYLTQIFKSFKSDRYFPEFKSSGNYRRIRDPEVDDSMQEENGIKFQFQVYERVK